MMYICACTAPGLPPERAISSRIALALGQREAAAAVGLGHQRSEPAAVGQRRHELVGVAVGLEPPPVLAGEARTQLAHRGADAFHRLGEGEIHYDPAGDMR